MRYLILIATLALALPAQAADLCMDIPTQTQACVATVQADDDSGKFLKDLDNAKLCVANGLSVGCTQAQVNAAGIVEGTIYAESGAGTAAWFKAWYISEGGRRMLGLLQADAAKELRDRLYIATGGGNVTDLVALCTAIGKNAICE